MPKRCCAGSQGLPRGCARTSGRRSTPWSSSAAGRWSCSAPAGASRRCTSWPPRCCGRRGAGPTVIVSPLLALMRNQIDAAARAGVQRGHGELGQHRRVGGHLCGDRRRRGGRPAGQPGAAEQPRLPRPGAAPAHRERGSAGGGRGALRVGLGARLPARLPPAARADRRAAAGDPGAGHHGDGERPGGPRRHRAAGARVRGAAGAARLAGPREPAAVGRAAADARAAAGVARRAPGGAAGCRDRVHAHGRRRGRGRGVPARARVPGRVLHRQDRAGAAAGRGGGPAGEPGQGAGGHQRAGHGVRQAGPRLRRAPRRAVLARRLLPADRPGRARGVERAEVVLLPGAEDRDIWAYFASLAFPPEPLVRRTLDVLSESAAVDRRDRDPGRPVAHPPGDAAEGPRQSTARCTG